MLFVWFIIMRQEFILPFQLPCFVLVSHFRWWFYERITFWWVCGGTRKIRRVIILKQISASYFWLSLEERGRTVANCFDQFPMWLFRRCNFRFDKFPPLYIQHIFTSPRLMGKTPLIRLINKIIPKLIVNYPLHHKLLLTIPITLIRFPQFLIFP